MLLPELDCVNDLDKLFQYKLNNISNNYKNTKEYLN